MYSHGDSESEHREMIGRGTTARHVAAGLYAIGGISLIVTMSAAAGTTQYTVSVYGAIGALLTAVAVALWRSMPRPVLMLLPLPGVLLVSAVIAMETRSPDPLLLPGSDVYYLWPILYAAYFFERKVFALTVAVLAGSLYAAVHGTRWAPPHAEIFIDVMFTVPTAGLLVLVMRERLESMITRLYSDATTDSLTELRNRRAFGQSVERALGGATKNGSALSLVMFDLDHFKRVNDEFGHDAGDELLRRFAAVLEAESRSDDITARLGGEEFAVLLAGTQAEEATLMADRVRRSLTAVSGLDGRAQTVSAGIVGFAAGDRPVSAETLIKRGDLALYAAKHAGRDRHCVWSEDEQPTAA